MTAHLEYPRGRPWRAAAAIVLLFASIACGRGDSRSPNAREYELEGEVVAVDKARREVTVKHEAIEGLMDAMVMPFRLRDEWAFEILEKGDRVRAALVVDGERSWLEQISIAKPAVPAAAGSASAESILEPGDPVPDVALVDQDEQPLTPSDFRGAPFFVTFIYTRCPMPDFCPLMNRNFLAIHDATTDAERYGDVRLLSVTVDPEHDTPAVLQEYGRRYLRGDEPFARWRFATGSPEAIRSLATAFGLAYMEQGEEIVHSLRTALVGGDGRVVKIYSGNEWTPERALADLEALRAPG